MTIFKKCLFEISRTIHGLLHVKLKRNINNNNNDTGTHEPAALAQRAHPIKLYIIRFNCI